MNSLLKKFLLGFSLPCVFAMGTPHKYKTVKHYREAPEPLKFGSDGKFKILHLTDIHCVDPEMDDDENRNIPRDKFIETINVIEECVKQTNPDLVVFGGDNISGYWEEFTYDYIEKTIKAITEPIVKRNIPLALVFGNHDGECGFHTEIQMIMYSEYKNCRSSLNDEDISGCGNCNITIKSSDGKKDAFSIFLVDSNDYMKTKDGKIGYDFVKPDQIEWFLKVSEKQKKENGNVPLPAILFQHMPVQQEVDMLTEGDGKDKNNSIESGGKIYSLGNKKKSGRFREYPCPACMDFDHREELLSWKKAGNVVAAFFGHDHNNDFCVNVDGIDLYQTIGAGYFTYGMEHGGRLIVLSENNPREIETEIIEVPRITATEF